MEVLAFMVLEVPINVLYKPENQCGKLPETRQKNPQMYHLKPPFFLLSSMRIE